MTRNGWVGLFALTACTSAAPLPSGSPPEYETPRTRDSAVPVASVDAPSPARSAEPTPSASPTASAAPLASADAPSPGGNPIERRANGLVIEELKIGTGPAVKPGNHVAVMYVGSLVDGTIFDQSKMPFEAEIGKHQLIEGWEQGIIGMRAGGKRKLTIPPALGYGARGAPPKIPPNATLVFEVELGGIF